MMPGRERVNCSLYQRAGAAFLFHRIVARWPGRYAAAMAEIINLRMARKARDRARAAQDAAENRTRFGRTKAEKTRDATDAARLDRTVDGARRESDEPR
jgi:hypothetical protein